MSELRYPHIIAAIRETPWAILPEKLAEITDFIAFKAAGGEVTAEEIRERFGARRGRKSPETPERIAVLPIHGTISHRMGLLTEASGGTSVEQLRADFRALVSDPKIDAIVLDVDSPGGTVAGIAEFADEIYKARGMKPISAVANTLMASAAYWIASAADEIVVTPSAVVGSIGVLAAHENRAGMYEKLGVDVSLISAGKYKAENNPFEPLSDEGRAEIQKRVDEVYGMFTRAVARGRGVPVDEVRNGFGEGRVVGAREAIKLGMADRLATIDDVIATIPTNRDAETAAMTPGLVAVPYEAHGQRVAADLDLFIQATRDRVAFRRVEKGRRPLSAAHRERLASIRDLALEASSALGTLLAETDPDSEMVRCNPLSFRGAQRARLLLAGIETGDD